METNKQEIDRLLANMNEKEIYNILSILDIYITERSLDEIKIRINSEEMNPMFERKMRWIAEFKKFMEETIKK